MKPAAEEVTEILVHYLRRAAAGDGLRRPDDTFAEIEGVMQGLIDEAANKAIAIMRGTEKPQLLNEPVQGGCCTPLIEEPDEPEPLGPMCARPIQDADGDSR